MEVGDTEGVVLLVELPEEGVEALGGVVYRSGVCRVEDVGLAASREDNVDVSLGDFAAGSSVAVDAHRSEVDYVGVDVGVEDGTAEVVGS